MLNTAAKQAYIIKFQELHLNALIGEDSISQLEMTILVATVFPHTTHTPARNVRDLALCKLLSNKR